MGRSRGSSLRGIISPAAIQTAVLKEEKILIIAELRDTKAITAETSHYESLKK